MLAAAAGAPVPALMDVYWAWRRAYDLAELDAPGYWREVGRALGRGYGEAQIAELIRLEPGGLAAAADRDCGADRGHWPPAGRPLALLSNAPDKHSTRSSSCR